ncbi:hypothetical protein [Streptomyces sp. NPDC047000]
MSRTAVSPVRPRPHLHVPQPVSRAAAVMIAMTFGPYARPAAARTL